MVEPVTTTVGLGVLAAFLRALPEHVGAHIVGTEAHRTYHALLHRLSRRLVAGGLPPNEDLERAVRRSLAGAALLFAYAFLDPDRSRPLSEL